MKTSVKTTNLDKLIVYSKAKNLALECFDYFYKLKPDKRSDFLIIQLLKAVTSIGANIAEGYGRHYRKNYRQFLSIARGSCYEVDYWIEIAINLKKYNNEVLEDFKKRNLELIKMISVMMKNIERKTQF